MSLSLFRATAANRRTPSRTHRYSAVALATTLLTLGWSQRASAQVPTDTGTQRLPVLGRSLAGTDDSTALGLNPANIGFMKGGEFRWSAIFLDDDLSVPWQGHAFSFATPLFLNLSSGLRVDIVDPPDSAAESGNYQFVTWGLALSATDAFSLGFSLQRSYSDSAIHDRLASYTIAMTSRPAPAVGLSFVANDINGPRNQAGGSRSPSYDMGMALRPTGERTLELGLETKYIQDSDEWVPRGTIGLDIAPLGRLTGGVTLHHLDQDEPDYVASLGLSLYNSNPAGSTEFTGGAVGGNALGADDSYANPYLDLAVRTFREPVGGEAPRYAVRVRIESTPDPRGHFRMMRRLWKMANEDAVDAVLLELRTDPADSFAHAQEFRDAIHNLRRHGKKVLCHLEDNGGMALYLCSAATKILVNPAGGLRFAGLKTQSMYFAGLLNKLGIRADFVRIGAHKSAPERLTRTGASKVAKADRIDMLQQLERQLVEGVAAGRRMTPAEVRANIKQGPFIASEAKQAKFVDGVAFDDELEDAVRTMIGRDTLVVDEDVLAPRAPKKFGRERGIAVIYVDGDMVDGRSSTIPFLGMKLAGSYTIAETLKDVREDPRIGAVVLRVETPGGSAMAADVMWRQVELTAKTKPLVVSMGSYAASAGYYISAPGNRIFANPATITGSIGVFYGKADVAQLLNKIGVNVETYKTAPKADAESLYRPFTAAERKELEKKVGQFYDTFITRVAAGRPLNKAQVDQVARGRVWTGEQAKDRKLVDELGGIRQALDYARRQAGLSEDAPIVELPELQTSILGKLLGIDGLRADAQITIPQQISGMIKALGPFMVYESDKPMMLLEMAPVKP
ncbi:MAG: signal peptide peptidase SppA [Myxococcales bacterium]|nr:signal peptide peptidase SppA [Myxococcales bacterium]